MMTPEDFEKACSAWLQDKNVATSEAFAGIVAASFNVLGMFQRDLAREFEVVESTVSRWAKGTARPHPLLQKQIVRSLLRRVKGLNPRRASSSSSPSLPVAVPFAAKSS